MPQAGRDPKQKIFQSVHSFTESQGGSGENTTVSFREDLGQASVKLYLEDFFLRVSSWIQEMQWIRKEKLISLLSTET